MNKTQPLNQPTQRPDLTKVQPKVGNAPLTKEQIEAKRAENPATHGSKASNKDNNPQKSRP